MDCEATALAEIEVFRSDHLLVRTVGRSGSPACVVTFNCFLDVPGLDVPGFGEQFLREHEIDAVHVTCAGNDWYQYPEWPAALGVIRSVVRPYARVLAYGSSMGGYAAVRYGGLAGAHEALAISPQFSIDPRRLPLDGRWRAIGGRLRFLHEGEPIATPFATVVYDARDLDRHHADLLAAALPIRRVPLIHAGHPAGAYLAETGLLPELVLGLLNGRMPPDFGRRARAARRRSGQYAFTLSHRLSFDRFAVKLALARLAVGTSPREPAYQSHLGQLLDLHKDPAAAEAAHRRAVALAPRSPIFTSRLARFLLRHGRVAEAVPWAEAAAGLAPDDHQIRHLRVVAFLAEGRSAAAARLVLTGPAGWASPRDLYRDWTWLLTWRPDPMGWRRRWSRRRRPRLPLRLGGS